MFDPFTDWTQDASYVNAVSTRLRHDHTCLTFQGALRLAGPPIGLNPAPPLTKTSVERETDTARSQINKLVIIKSGNRFENEGFQSTLN